MNQERHPTRVELREVKRKLAVARRGHDLLKRKQDSLMVEFFRNLNECRRIRKEAAEARAAADHAMGRAEVASGRMGVWSFGLTRAGLLGVEVTQRSYMGAHLPEMRPATVPDIEPRLPPGERLDSFQAARAAERFLRSLIALAAVEARLGVILNEIDRAKRRVNALEMRVIPQLEEDRRFIQSHLDEMEREGLFTLKRIRAKIGARATA